MQIKVNGKDYHFNNLREMTISSLLEQLKIKSIKVVIEKNGTIIDESCYKNDIVTDGDRLEIVQFVGGG